MVTAFTVADNDTWFGSQVDAFVSPARARGYPKYIDRVEEEVGTVRVTEVAPRLEKG